MQQVRGTELATKEVTMSRYSDLLSAGNIRTILSKLEPISKTKCEELRTEYPVLRPDYLDFLGEVGYGVIGQNWYMLYDGVLPLRELLADACRPTLADLLAFGDTTGGTCHAFDPSNGMRVLAIYLDTQEVELVNSSFEGFIRELLTSFVEEMPVQDNVDGSSP
jgi:hypothetical protein